MVRKLGFCCMLFVLVCPFFLYGGWSWGSEEEVYNDETQNSITSLNNAWCVAVGDGVKHAVWNQNEGAPHVEIYYSRKSGASWSAGTRLSADDGSPPDTNDANPSITAVADTVNVVWQNYGIHHKKSEDAGDSWGSISTIEYASGHPSIAATGTNVHLVYSKVHGNAYDIFYRKSTDSGTSWSSAIQLCDIDDYPRSKVIFFKKKIKKI